MSKPSPITSGREGRFHVQLDEHWPAIVGLVEAPAGQPGTVLPAKLVQARQKAAEALKAAEDDLVRWVKYSDPSYAQRYLAALVSQLPERQKK